jgi:ribosomal protein L11 methyltransferase
MSWLQLALKTNHSKVELYSECLINAGAVAITLQPGTDEVLFEPLPNTIPLWEQTIVIGLFEANVDQVAIKKFLKTRLGREIIKNLHFEPLVEQNWLNAGRDQLHPMRFGEKLIVCPSWCASPDPNAINILLDPGLAFGSGTHPTTRLCLEWLETHPPQDALVIDYGCGSGILGITALKLGAAQVYAIDYDPQALVSTKENAKKNDFNETEMMPILPNAFASSRKADLLLANILADPLIELAPFFSDYVRKDGMIVLSGLLENQIEKVFLHYQQSFKLLEVTHLEEWVRLSAIKYV